jgi:hypothetical protein
MMDMGIQMEVSMRKLARKARLVTGASNGIGGDLPTAIFSRIPERD